MRAPTTDAAPPLPVGGAVTDARHAFVQAVAVLAVFSVARAFGLLGPPGVAVAVLVVALTVVARRTHASRDDLGLRRSSLRAGLQYGGAAFLLVLVVLLVAALLPATRGFLHDTRAEMSGGRLVYELGVSVLLLTVLPEEFAFRGLLLGSAVLMWGERRAAVVTSLLFGLWHIAPTLHTAADNRALEGTASTAWGLGLLVLGAVAATFIAGLVFSWLRLRSRSLLAPVMAHCATNALALTVAWFATH